MLVEQLAEAAWDLKQARRVARCYWEYVGGSYSRGPAGIAEAQCQERGARFRTHFRDRSYAERSCYAALDAWTEARRRSSTPAPKARAAASVAAEALIIDNILANGSPVAASAGATP